VLLAMFFALLGNAIIRLLRRLSLPRFVAALLVLALGMFGTYTLARELIAPAGEWIREVPKELRSLAPKLRTLTKPMTEANRAAENIARAAGGETSRSVQVVKTEVDDPYKILTSTPRMIASVLAVVLLTFFFMIYGGDLQRNAVALLPGRQQKKLTVEILQAIETAISR
jgi:predicted PurR-regulated permease PerM